MRVRHLGTNNIGEYNVVVGSADFCDVRSHHKITKLYTEINVIAW